MAVKVVAFEDLQCSDCAAFTRMLDEVLLPRFGSRVVFVERDFPLPQHSWARKAAIVSRYFSEIDSELALAYRRHMLADPKAADFDGRVAEFAAAHSVGVAKALAAISDTRLADLVERDYQDGIVLGVVKTPTVYVHGKPFVERFSAEEISEAIDRALAEAA